MKTAIGKLQCSLVALPQVYIEKLFWAFNIEVCQSDGRLFKARNDFHAE